MPIVEIERIQKPELGVGLDFSNPLTQGLVGFWALNERAGRTIQDLSGNVNQNGVLGDGVSWVAEHLHFAGAVLNSEIDLGNSDLFEITTSDPFSLIIEYRTTTTTQRNLIGKNEGSLVKWWNLGINIVGTTGRLTWEADDDVTKRQIDGVIATNDNQWHTAFIVRTPGVGYELFVDGESDGTVADSGDCSNSEKCFVGSSTIRIGASDFLGDVRYATIIRKTLTVQELTAIIQNPWQLIEPIRIPIDVAAAPAGLSAIYYRTLLQGGRV